jgi:glycerol-3-phosphate acyltransferase PlsY
VIGLVLALILSYLAGSFPTAVVVGRLFFNRDPRNEGSGNAGGTNAFRVFGWKAGMAVALVDLGKGYLAAAALSLLAAGSASAPPPVAREGAMLLCGLAAVAGHVWTVFAGFRGGKGVATAAGALLAFAPAAFVPAAAAFALVLLSTGIVSLSSISAACALSVALIAPAFGSAGQSPWLLGFGLFAAPFITFTHRANIGRLLRRQEKRFEKVALLRRLFVGRGGRPTS